MNQNYKLHKEWFKQDEYDLETAQAMFKAGRNIYTVFMCHLSIEKALKGLYAKKFKKDPPKIHDLVYLIKKTELTLPKENEEFLKILNELSVPTRYPDEIEKNFKTIQTRKN